MGIKKQYLKNKPVCKVTFKIPGREANGAKSISIAGDFNDWNANCISYSFFYHRF